MSFLFLVALLGAGLFHGLKLKQRTHSAVAEIMLVYVLVGYCGIYMVLAGILDLAASFRNGTIFPFPAGGATQQFFDFALLAMATMAIFSVRLRGRYLASPAIGWSPFLVWRDVHSRRESLCHRRAFAVGRLGNFLIACASGACAVGPPFSQPKRQVRLAM